MPTPIIQRPDHSNGLMPNSERRLVITWQPVTARDKSRRKGGKQLRPPWTFWRTYLLGHTFQLGWFTQGMDNFTNSRVILDYAHEPGRWELWTDFGSQAYPELMSVLIGVRTEEKAKWLAEQKISRYFEYVERQLNDRLTAIRSQPVGKQSSLF